MKRTGAKDHDNLKMKKVQCLINKSVHTNEKLKIRLISNFSINGYDKECQIASNGQKI